MPMRMFNSFKSSERCPPGLLKISVWLVVMGIAMFRFTEGVEKGVAKGRIDREGLFRFTDGAEMGVAKGRIDRKGLPLGSSAFFGVRNFTNLFESLEKSISSMLVGAGPALDSFRSILC